MAHYTESETREAAIALLNAFCSAAKDVNGKPKVYANVTGVSRSGMSRTIKFWVIDRGERDREEPWLCDINRHIGALTGNRVTDKGVHVRGCGMDMGWYLLDYAQRAANNYYAGTHYESKRDQIQPTYI